MVSQVVAPPTLAGRASDHTSICSAVAYAATCLLMCVAPFELTRPIVRLPRQSVSNLEALVLCAFVGWLGVLAWSRRWPVWRTPLTAPWLTLLAVMAISAAAAPTARTNALHMTGRVAAAFAIVLLAFNGTTTATRFSRVILAALGAGALVATLAMLESLRVGAVLEWLKAFRPGISVVGAQLRAGGPLRYPTIASMYLEIVLALGLGVLMASVDAGRRAGCFAIIAALLLIAEGIILTFTRAGLVSMAVSITLVAVWRARSRGIDSGVRSIGVLSLLVAALFFTSRPAQSIWLRLTSEGQENWYRSAITPPVEVVFAAGEVRDIPVRVTNTGRLTWDSTDSQPFYLSYHWLEPTADRVVSFEGLRTAFAAPVEPDATTTMLARVRAPNQPGHYRLGWDIVQEGRLWFSTEPGSALTFSQATVTGAVAAGRTATTSLPLPAERPGRRLLWSAAARLLVAHPLFGVGPDNFRLLYGPYAGLRTADSRTHSNNMYLEMMVGSGVLGGLAFAWLVWRIAAEIAAGVRAATTDRRMAPALGVAAAVAAIGLHGLVDSFVGFTPTYVLIALTLGLAQAGAHRANTETNADRI